MRSGRRRLFAAVTLGLLRITLTYSTSLSFSPSSGGVAASGGGLVLSLAEVYLKVEEVCSLPHGEEFRVVVVESSPEIYVSE